MDFFVKYHCAGDASDPLAKFEFDECKAAIQLEREMDKSASWASLFKGRGNLKRMRIIIAIAFFSQWSGNGLVSYYLVSSKPLCPLKRPPLMSLRHTSAQNSVLKSVGVSKAETRTLINGILQITNYATAIFGAMMVDRLGRRFLFLASTIGMTLFFTRTYAVRSSRVSSGASADILMSPRSLYRLCRSLQPVSHHRNRRRGNRIALCRRCRSCFHRLYLHRE